MDNRPYEQALRWLYALEAAKGMDFKLERVQMALRRLGDPHRRYPTLHIAGTNGKGSVAAFAHAMLCAQGYRAGLYTSPHLVRFNERIRVGLQEIPDEAVVELTAELQRTVTGNIGLTFFELVTVMAFVYFARRGVDVAVIEVGLGGRLDATNVIEPEVAVITNIGHDHAEFLGNTLASVAAEKGGIIKPGRPVVLGRMRRRAESILVRMACERGAPVLRAGRDYSMSEDKRPTFSGLGLRLENLEIGLLGGHQRDNAASALAAIGAVRSVLPVSESAVRQGLLRVRWPGRLEVHPGTPLVILDGAHNPEGIDALLSALPSITGERSLHALFAVMRDKRWRRMAARLGAACRSVTVTEVLPPRGLPSTAAAAVFARHCAVTVETDPVCAFNALRARLGAGDALLVTGSLFLIGAVYESVVTAESLVLHDR